MAKKEHNKSLVRIFVVAVLVLAAAWITSTVSNVLQYRRFYAFAQNDLGENLSLLAQTVGNSISIDWIEAVQFGMPELAEVDESKMLYSLVREHKLYTVALMDTSGKLFFCTDKQIPLGEQNPYWAAERKAFEKAAFGIPSFGGLRRVGGIYLRTGFAPVYDNLGDVVAIVGIEAGAEYFGLLSSLRNGVWIYSVATGVSVMFMIVLLWFGKRRLDKLSFHLEDAATLSGIGLMAATMAHEIKNPLAIIKNSAEMISYSEPREISELVRFIDEEVDRLAAIVESHLSVAGNRDFPKTRQKLSSVIEKILPRYQEQLGQRGVGVIVEIDDDPIVPYSVSSIRQVLYNLMENAAAAVESGGIIRVSTKRENFAGAEYGTITVTDSGKGIDRDQMKELFKPFHTTKKEGTGLGLYISQKIIEGHGGKITVESEPSVFTRFKIWLPK